MRLRNALQTLQNAIRTVFGGDRLLALEVENRALRRALESAIDRYNDDTDESDRVSTLEERRIRAEEREKCAKVADSAAAGKYIAAAIRAIENP